MEDPDEPMHLVEVHAEESLHGGAGRHLHCPELPDGGAGWSGPGHRGTLRRSMRPETLVHVHGQGDG
jgi:hypothetical protein